MSELIVKNISKNFGGVKAVSDFSMNAKSGEIHGLIGPNGAGKTTIFNLISGVYPSAEGQILLDGKNLLGINQYKVARMGISRTFQNIRCFEGLSVLENVMTASDNRTKYGIWGSLFPTPLRLKEERENRLLCEDYLEKVGLLEFKDEKPSNLPYGLQRRLEIARALACQPKVLLLDEPAAGLNPIEVKELTELIKVISDEEKFIIIVIEHRLDLIMRISDIIHVQNFGETIATGIPSDIQKDPLVIEAYLGKED